MQNLRMSIRSVGPFWSAVNGEVSFIPSKKKKKTCGGFLKWGYPQIIYFNGILTGFSIKNPSKNGGTPMTSWKPPSFVMICRCWAPTPAHRLQFPLVAHEGSQGVAAESEQAVLRDGQFVKRMEVSVSSWGYPQSSSISNDGIVHYENKPVIVVPPWRAGNPQVFCTPKHGLFKHQTWPTRSITRRVGIDSDH